MSNFSLTNLFYLFLVFVLALGGVVGITAAISFDGFEATLTLSSLVETLTIDGDIYYQLTGNPCGSSCGSEGA
jgi:hypothetical protein